MAGEEAVRARNRRWGQRNMGRKWMIFAGDCSQVGEELAKKPNTPLWVTVGFLDALLRSYGQVVFCNNPVSGLMILIALLVACPFSAAVGLAAVSVAIFTAWLVDQPIENVRAGLCSYNALLVGQVSAVLLPELAPIDWLFIIGGSALSVYFSSAFGTLFHHISKYPLPAFTVPFVVAQILVYMCATSPVIVDLKLAAVDATGSVNLQLNGDVYNLTSDFVNNTSDSIFNSSLNDMQDFSLDLAAAEINVSRPTNHIDTEAKNVVRSNSSDISLDWGEVVTGILRATAQVYGQKDLPSSLLMLVGVIASSPTTACMGLLGAVVSTLVGVLLSGSGAGERAALYEGAWGFNGLLAAGGVGGFALVLTPQAAGLALVAALLAGLLQSALAPAFQAGGVPLTTLPFNLSALLLLCVSARGQGSLVRPAAISFPEKHRRDWRDASRAQDSLQIQPSPAEPTAEEEAERKEEFRKLETV